MAMPRTLSFWPSEAIGLPPPSEKRPTSGTGAANTGDLLKAAASAVGVKLPLTQMPLV